TYAQFIDPKSPYVTPVPHPDLGKLKTYTLTATLDEKATSVPVVESTKDASKITGFFIRGSVTLQIDDELITYGAAAGEAPFAFSACKRGAYGTKVAAHSKGAKVHRLRGCFRRFVADGESALYTEVAAKTAELFNDCGFDMIYLDALDGSDAVAGREWSWYYGSKFTWEIWKRLKRPALMEMSTFHHHLWYVRSRMGAWDHPVRSHKKFIDIHCQANQRWQRSFLPTNLGWWAFKTWHGQQAEPTYPDDIEYLCAKAVGNDSSLSIMGINPSTIKTIAVLPRLAAIMRRYENLRNANYFTNEVKAQLRVPGDEFRLEQADDGEWQFRQVQYAKHKVQGLEGWSNTWKTENRFGRQPVKLRIEALYSTGAYEADGNITLADFSDAKDFPTRNARKGLAASLTPSTKLVKGGSQSGCYKASNPTGTPVGAWTKMGKTFAPTINLSGHQALGVWIHGDGKGEVLNLQFKSPSNMTRAQGDHHVPIDFVGWRYFELVEIEGERHADHRWPYGGMYSVYREQIRMNAIEQLNLYYNDIPAKGEATCYLSPIKAVPLVKAKVRNPAVTIGGKTIRFPVEIETGYCLEYRSATDCKLYGPKGELISEITPVGEELVIEPGANDITFTCDANGSQRPRAYVWAITEGKALRGRKPKGEIRWNLLDSEVDDPRVITAFDGVRNQWDITCRSEARLELELTVDKIGGQGAAYSASTALPIDAFDSVDAYADTPQNEYAKYVVSGVRKGFPTALGVTQKLELYRGDAKVGKSCVRYTATSKNVAGWSARGRRFSPTLDLSSCTDIGFWIHGDAKGETLYLQLRDVAGKWIDMKTSVDFDGWRYVEFPLAGPAADLSKIEYLIIYYNSIPAGATVDCRIDDVRGLRKSVALANPTVTVSGKTLVFPVSLSAKDRLVYNGDSCEVFVAGAKKGKAVTPAGALPKLHPGRNSIEVGVSGAPPEAFRMRATVTASYEK
ncbi:MAG: hypothetical protein KAI66_03400, partial [Lentisphaeria bacterium]|nr:hypothetical protein [Lentisphaeria bacterium]